MDKHVILIGGVAGSGKTTLSNLLLHRLGLDHSLGLGWVREVVCQFCSPVTHPELFTYSFRPSNSHTTPYDNLHQQSVLLKPFMEACIDRARREGTSLLLEGVNLIPGIINPEVADYHFYLKSPNDLNMHKRMILGSPHQKREISDLDMARLREIEAISLKNCEENEIPIIEFATNEVRLEHIVYYLGKGESNHVGQSALQPGCPHSGHRG